MKFQVLIGVLVLASGSVGFSDNPCSGDSCGATQPAEEIRRVAPPPPVVVELAADGSPDLSKITGPRTPVPTGSEAGSAPPALPSGPTVTPPLGGGPKTSTDGSSTPPETGGSAAQGPSALAGTGADAIRREVSDRLNQGEVVSKEVNGKHFLFVHTEGDGLDHPMFIHDQKPNDGRFYVQDAKTKTTVWAPPQIELQAKAIYAEWKKKNPKNDPFPAVGDKALAFQTPPQVAQPTPSGSTTTPAGTTPTPSTDAPKPGETASTKPEKPGDHIVDTHGQGLKPRPSSEEAEGRNKPFAKTKKIFDGKPDDQTTLDDIKAATAAKKVTKRDKDYFVKTMRQECYAKNSGDQPEEVTVTLLTDANDPTHNHVFMQKGKVTPEQWDAHLDTAVAQAQSGGEEGPQVLKNTPPANESVNYTEAITNEGLKQAGFTHTQIALKKDESGGFAMRYAQKKGKVGDAEGAEDVIFYCVEAGEAKKTEAGAKVERDASGRRKGSSEAIKGLGTPIDLVKQYDSCMKCHLDTGDGPQSAKEFDMDRLNLKLGLIEGTAATMPKGQAKLSKQDAQKLSDYIKGLKDAAK